MKKQKNKDHSIMLTIIVVVLLIIFCAMYNIKYRSENVGWGWMHMYGANNGLFGSGNERDEWNGNNMMNNNQGADKLNRATKTPRRVFEETQSINLIGTTSLIISDQITPRIEAVFGNVKPTAFSGEYLGQANSFFVTFKTARIILGDDVDKLISEFSKGGYSVGTKTIVDGSTNILLDNKKVTITISYLNSSSQDLGVLYMEKVYE